MFLWPEGYKRVIKNPLQELIEKSQGDILLMIEEELFVKQCHLGDSLAIDTLVQGTQGFLEVMFMDYQYVLPEHFESLSTQYSIMWELIDLDVDKVNQEILKHYNLAFNLLNNNHIVGIQWLFALRILRLVQKNNQDLLKNNINLLPLLFNHLDEEHIPEIITLLLKCSNQSNKEFQHAFLKRGFSEFLLMNEITSMSFVNVIHNIFLEKLEVIDYLLNTYIVKSIYEAFINTSLTTIVRKSAGHIISLITNYYSQELQDLDLEEEDENKEINEKFENSIFFNLIQEFLPNILRVLDINQNGSLIIKTLEIIDNLIRITNLNLWKIMESCNLCDELIKVVQKNQRADIIISQVERTTFYILERAINDFHPFWAFNLINKLQYNNINMFNRQLYSFEQQLNSKIHDDLDYITYDELLDIQQQLQKSIIWQQSKIEIKKQIEENQQKLGSQMLIEETIKITSVSQLDELFKKSEEDSKQLLISEQKIQHTKQTKNRKENLSHSSNLDDISNISNKCYHTEKVRKQSQQFEQVSQNLQQIGRRLSLQAGLKIKELCPTYEEFKIDLERKKLRKLTDNSELQVDELDISQ